MDDPCKGAKKRLEKASEEIQQQTEIMLRDVQHERSRADAARVLGDAAQARGDALAARNATVEAEHALGKIGMTTLMKQKRKCDTELRNAKGDAGAQRARADTCDTELRNAQGDAGAQRANFLTEKTRADECARRLVDAEKQIEVVRREAHEERAAAQTRVAKLETAHRVEMEQSRAEVEEYNGKLLETQASLAATQQELRESKEKFEKQASERKKAEEAEEA